MLPSTFEQGGRFFTNAYTAFDATPFPVDPSYYATPSVAGEGVAFRTSVCPMVIGTTKTLPLLAGHTFEVAIRTKVLVNPTNYGDGLRVYSGVALFDGAGTSLGNIYTTASLQVVADGAVTRANSLTTASLLATYPTATYARAILIFNYRDEAGGAVGSTHEAYFLSFRDVTDRAAAAGSASAAATSASSAATSSSAAGASATAASGSATTASTQAGLALTYAGQSSTSASGAASSASTAGTAATTATSAAATASTQASNASASAASASFFASIAAGASSGALNRNSGFDDYPVAGYGNLPTGWVHWTGNGGYRRIADSAGGYSLECSKSGFADVGLLEDTDVGTIGPDSWYVLEVEAERLSGANWNGSGWLIAERDAAGNAFVYTSLDFTTAPDASGVTSATKAGRRTWTRLFKTGSNAATTKLLIYAMAGWSGFVSGGADAKVFAFHRILLRPANDQEVQQQTVFATLGASVTAQATAMQNLVNGYSLARYTLSATTPGGAAILSLVSTTYGSVAGLSADQIYLGENTIFDNATDTWRTTTGSTLRVTAMGAAFGTDGTLLEWEGSSAVAFASMSRANAYHYTANAAPYAGGSRRLVRTDTVENEAISKEWRYDSQGVTSYTASGAMTTRVTMFSMTLTATGKKITFDGKYLLHARHSQDAWNLYVVVERFSSSTTTDVFLSKRGAQAISGDGYISDWQHISFTDTPPAGSTVYTVRVYHDYLIGGPGAFNDYDVSNRIMSAREHRTET